MKSEMSGIRFKSLEDYRRWLETSDETIPVPMHIVTRFTHALGWEPNPEYEKANFEIAYIRDEQLIIRNP